MKNNDKIVDNDAIKMEKNCNIKKPKEKKGIVNDDKFEIEHDVETKCKIYWINKKRESNVNTYLACR